MLNYLKPIIDLEKFIGRPAAEGLRFNPLRLDRTEFERILPFEIEHLPFYKYGYLLKNGDNAGTHPLHAAGVYYIQEPSAMAAVTALDIKPYSRVLDMCAAPGSKSTAIAGELTDGFLVANEVNAKRAQALISNIERMGISRAMVLNSNADDIAKAFEGCFDRVLVDSPCSGEGMFRKHPKVLELWSVENVMACAERSKKILNAAAKTVCPGGRLVYSTCTFNTEENEKVIIDFLNSHPDFSLVDTGITGADYGLLGLAKAVRIYPSDISEGHFIAALVRRGTKSEFKFKYFKSNTKSSGCKDIIKHEFKFLGAENKQYILFDTGTYTLAIPQNIPHPQKLRVLRAGVKLSEQSYKTVLPCHHLFMSNSTDNFSNEIDVDENLAVSFLKGMPLKAPKGMKGFAAVKYKSFCIGFGKATDGVLKNHLPRGLFLS